LVQYVERNALKAKLVDKAENWKWSSVWRRVNGNYKQKSLLSVWPVDIPDDYLLNLNQKEIKTEEEDIEKSMIKNTPFGDEYWTASTVKQFSLEQTLRNAGRPKIRNS